MLCVPGYKVVSLAEMTKLAEEVIVKDQLQAHIDATVDKETADYAIVSNKESAVVVAAALAGDYIWVPDIRA